VWAFDILGASSGYALFADWREFFPTFLLQNLGLFCGDFSLISCSPF